MYRITQQFSENNIFKQIITIIRNRAFISVVFYSLTQRQLNVTELNNSNS